jgi:uncharacterized protein YecT (DUF1311 family)
MKKIFVAFLLCVCSSGVFSQTQLEMNMDALKTYQKADAEMTAIYKKALKSLTDTAQRRMLIQAQRSWIKYKEDHCRAVAAFYEGGSMQPMVYSECKTEVTRQRIKSLQAYLENL